MKRFLFAVAVLALAASVGSAEDQPATPAPNPTPVVTAGTPAYSYAPAQTQRRGLFGRLRNRNNSTTYYNTTPMMTAPAATPMPGVAPTPMPMPGVKPAGGAATGMVVPATGNLPPGQYTTTDGTIVQIGGTQPMMNDTTMPRTTSRTGLFSRLRNR
jgi:hypothetical protein